MKGSCNRQEYMAFPQATRSSTLLTAVAILMCGLKSRASDSREFGDSIQGTRQLSTGTSLEVALLYGLVRNTKISVLANQRPQNS